jgi:hypothetical protein
MDFTDGKHSQNRKEAQLVKVLFCATLKPMFYDETGRQF